MVDDGHRGVLVAIADVVELHAAGRCHLNAFALLLLRGLLQLHQSLGRGEYAHEGGSQTCQVAGRSLDAVDQLQEGRHLSEGDGASAQSDRSPEEGDEIAQRETAVDEEVAGYRELGALAHVMAQFRLRVAESVDHLVAGLQCFDEHAVLHGLGQQALHLTVAVAHPAGVLPHLSHIDTADEDEQRQDAHGDEGQPHIHLEQVEEGAQEEGHG